MIRTGIERFTQNEPVGRGAAAAAAAVVIDNVYRPVAKQSDNLSGGGNSISLRTQSYLAIVTLGSFEDLLVRADSFHETSANKINSWNKSLVNY